MPDDIGALKKLFATWQEGMSAAGGWNAVFWCNHDQPRAVSRFGDGQKHAAKMLGTVIHFMRGTPYIYQGEELGMTNAGYTSIEQYRDVESLNYYDIMLKGGKTVEQAIEILAARSRDNGRTPMQWSAEKYAGFSSVEPWIIPPDNYTSINAQAEVDDPYSVFNYYRQLIALRKKHKIVADGDIKFIEADNEDVIAYERTLGAEKLTVLCNFRAHDVWIGRSIKEYGGEKLLGNYDGLEDHLRPYEAVVLIG